MESTKNLTWTWKSWTESDSNEGVFEIPSSWILPTLDIAATNDSTSLKPALEPSPIPEAMLLELSTESFSLGESMYKQKKKKKKSSRTKRVEILEIQTEIEYLSDMGCMSTHRPL